LCQRCRKNDRPELDLTDCRQLSPLCRIRRALVPGLHLPALPYPIAGQLDYRFTRFEVNLVQRGHESGVPWRRCMNGEQIALVNVIRKNVRQHDARLLVTEFFTIYPAKAYQHGLDQLARIVGRLRQRHHHPGAVLRFALLVGIGTDIDIGGGGNRSCAS
jgi:hypothetical protein